MRIVRYTKLISEDSGEAKGHARWGLLVDELVYPLMQAPYPEPQGADILEPEPVGPALRRQEVRLLAPVMPAKIVCVGRNYAEHAAELGNEVPAEPMIFLKPPSALIGPDEGVVYPAISARVDHEGELAVVIGRRCRNVPEAEADQVIFGYTVANDVTARDLQKRDGQWARAKGFDTFAPMGPWVDTTFSPSNRRIRCLVNDELRQDSNTDLMIYSIERIIAHVTRFMTLEPGDVILTGTPSGIAPVNVGDVMIVEIEGLGKLINPVVAEDTN